MLIDRRKLIKSAAALGLTAGTATAASADETNTPPLRVDWLPTGTNYNSSRSNRGRRPSIGTVLTGIARPESRQIFRETMAPVTSFSDTPLDFPAGGADFQLPAGGETRQRFDLRLSRLERSLHRIMQELGEDGLPAATEFCVAMSVGRARY